MDAIRKLFTDIEAILRRDNKTLGDLARELGRSYNQMYDWVRLRKFNPRAKALMELMQWRDQNISAPEKVSVR